MTDSEPEDFGRERFVAQDAIRAGVAAVSGVALAGVGGYLVAAGGLPEWDAAWLLLVVGAPRSWSSRSPSASTGLEVFEHGVIWRRWQFAPPLLVSDRDWTVVLPRRVGALQADLWPCARLVAPGGESLRPADFGPFAERIRRELLPRVVGRVADAMAARLRDDGRVQLGPLALTREYVVESSGAHLRWDAVAEVRFSPTRLFLDRDALRVGSPSAPLDAPNLLAVPEIARRMREGAAAELDATPRRGAPEVRGYPAADPEFGRLLGGLGDRTRWAGWTGVLGGVVIAPALIFAAFAPGPEYWAPAVLPGAMLLACAWSFARTPGFAAYEGGAVSGAVRLPYGEVTGLKFTQTNFRVQYIRTHRRTELRLRSPRGSIGLDVQTEVAEAVAREVVDRIVPLLAGNVLERLPGGGTLAVGPLTLAADGFRTAGGYLPKARIGSITVSKGKLKVYPKGALYTPFATASAEDDDFHVLLLVLEALGGPYRPKAT